MRFIFVLLFSFFIQTTNTIYANYSSEEQNHFENNLLSKKRRTDLINYLISLHNYKTYLEIGVADGTNFNEIIAVHKVGVDPHSVCKGVRRLTSDDYFSRFHETFDIIFIDGLHLHEQVLRDVNNSLRCLNPGGTIVMHDCMPLIERHQIRIPPPGESWNGDVWKAVAYIRMNYAGCSLYVLDIDCGCGVLTLQSEPQELFPQTPLEELNWDYYVKNKERVLNVKKLENWVDTYKTRDFK